MMTPHCKILATAKRGKSHWFPGQLLRVVEKNAQPGEVTADDADWLVGEGSAKYMSIDVTVRARKPTRPVAEEVPAE